jgi:hypothetical protein
VHLLDAMFRHPAVLAFTLATFAISLPTGLSVCLLALAFAELMLQPDQQQHACGAYLRPKPLLAGLMAWFLLSFALQATTMAPLLPEILQIGLFVTSAHLLALGPLLHPFVTVLFMCAITATAVHTRAQHTRTLWMLVHGRVPELLPGASRFLLPQRPCHLPQAAHLPTSCQTGAGSTLPLLMAVHMFGSVLMPMGWFSLSMLHMCYAGAVYVCGSAMEWLVTAVTPTHARRLCLPTPYSHLPMRAYAATHAAVLLAVFLAQPRVPTAVVEAMSGSASVSLRRDIAPVLAMFFIATAHAVLGAHIRRATGGGIPAPRAAPAATAAFTASASAGSREGCETADSDVLLLLIPPREAQAAVHEHEGVSRLKAQWQAAMAALGLTALQTGTYVLP